jgi:hypothetical protein
MKPDTIQKEDQSTSIDMELKELHKNQTVKDQIRVSTSVDEELAKLKEKSTIKK